MLRTGWRDALALVATGIVLAASAVTLLLLRPDPGITVVEREGEVVVGSVTQGSLAERSGIAAGDTVIATNGQSIAEAASYWTARGFEYPVGTVVASADEVTVHTAAGETTLDLHEAASLSPGSLSAGSIPVFLLGLAILVLGGWWLLGGRAASGLDQVAVPMVGAWAVPLLALPLTVNGLPLLRVLGAAGPPVMTFLFGDALASVLRRPFRLALASLGLGLAVGAAGLLLLPLLVHEPWSDAPAGALWALLAVTAIPAVLATSRRSDVEKRPAEPEAPGRAWLIGAAIMPAVAMLPMIVDPVRDWTAALVAPVWLIVLVAWRSVSTRIARARLQRDLVVNVTEAERSRLAAELHDVALQELTLLVRRLDATGDAAGAAMARSLSDRLRELCGELHLPILDELGAGAALDWLVEQVASATGEEVRLDRSDESRPPAGVELAVFRVAQEAIANAVKHGGPPILVRYMTSPSTATLSVDDGGSGTSGNAAIAPRPGHYGLTTMQQRADQIGALLAIRPWPGGGTRVSLEWRAP